MTAKSAASSAFGVSTAACAHGRSLPGISKTLARQPPPEAAILQTRKPFGELVLEAGARLRRPKIHLDIFGSPPPSEISETCLESHVGFVLTKVHAAA